MIEFNKNFNYTIIWTTSVKEVQRDYPHGIVSLLDEDGEYKLIAVAERR